MINKFSVQHTKKHQEGVTLVISLMLLAAVTFVSFSLSTLILREVIGARLLLNSEPALSAANAGGEVALLRLQRGQGGLNIPSTPLSQSTATYQVDPDLYDSPLIYKIACGSSPKEYWFPLYDTSNWENKNADYGQVTISSVSTPCNLRVRVFSWSQQIPEACSQVTIRSSSPSTTCNTLNAPLGDDRYIVAIESLGSSSQSANITISALANDGVTVRGIPAVNPTLQVTGKSREVERRIQIDLK